MREDPKAFRHAKDDHYLHWAAMIAVTAYMWQLQGPIAAIALLIGLIIAISLTNIIILARFAGFSAVRWSRWGWVIAAFILIAISNAEIGSVR